jgi:hypothetical protein
MLRHASIESIRAFTSEASHLQVSWLRSPEEAEAAIGSLSTKQAIDNMQHEEQRRNARMIRRMVLAPDGEGKWTEQGCAFL